MRRRSFLTLLAAASLASQAQQLQLARRGRFLLPIVISPEASARVRQAAQELATYLGMITGNAPAVITGAGPGSIAVGLPNHFPALDVSSSGTARPGQEDYWISSRASGMFLIGATETGVENAVWDFLHRLGYRQYFPGDHWEVIPQRSELSLQVDVHESPSYASRHIWYGYGPWDYSSDAYLRWRRRNRMPGAVALRTNHAYGGIIRALQKEFDEHPEYYPLIGGVRKASRNAKLCIGNATLRRLVVQHELEQFRKAPGLESVSLDPSDGGGWCECADCAALGTISDRVVVLANEVAAAVDQQFPGKLVGIYAYNYHSPPPSIRVHPNVVVSVATAFARGGMKVDEIMRGWAAQGATLGVREYYSVNTWDRDLPGQARGGNIEYLAHSIPAFHRQGARFLSAESSDNWGPNGLGYYVASRLLWDVREASRVGQIVDDFLSSAFGAAREPMRDFYRQLDGARPFLGTEETLPRMFQALREARRLAGTDPAVSARLDDLTLYAHYCALFRRYAVAGGAQRQAAFETLIRHAYRMRTTMMVHTKALYRDLVARDRSVSIPTGAEWNVPEGWNPWKSSQPFTGGEIEGFVAEGLRPRLPPPAAPAAFTERLAPAAGLLSPNAERGGWGAASGVQAFLVYAAQQDARIDLELIAEAREERGGLDQLRVGFARLDSGPDAADKNSIMVRRKSLDPHGRVVTLLAGEPGVYRLTVSSGSEPVLVQFPADLPFAVPAGERAPMNASYRQWHAYFYVPKGTKAVAFRGGEHGEVQDGMQRAIFWLNGRSQGSYSVPVPEGQDGRVWRIRDAEGPVTLLTVPPYFSPSAGQMLLPTEVLQKDF